MEMCFASRGSSVRTREGPLNTLIFKDIKVADITKMLVDKGLTNSENYKSVRTLIINMGKGWIYNLYFEVYKKDK